MPETTARSCVISSSPMPCSRCSRFSRSRICAWIVTSSAVVGSSAIRKSGSAASVIAIITRCFCPPREPERVLVDAPLGLRNADAPQPFDRLGARRIAAQRRVRLDRLDDLVADPHHRVQAGRRLLEDHADPAAAHGAHLRLPAARARRCRSTSHVALRDAAVVGQQAHQRQRGHALAAARFADQREGFAALDGQRQAVDRLQQAGVGVERRPSRSSAFSISRRLRPDAALPSARAADGASAERACARIEGVAHAVGEQVGRQHQRHHEAERRGERPPHHRVAAHLAARQVDHAAEAVHRRVDADADVATAPPRTGSATRTRAPW